MVKKGIILAGGKATRLGALTQGVSKSLLPIYDKPTIYYSLTTLLEQGCDDILIICRSEFKHNFEMLLGDGSEFGIKISYAIQDEPRGLAHAYIVAKDFLNGESSTMILGDNIFVGDIPDMSDTNNGCCVMEVPVKDASKYGVFDEGVNEFIEKPIGGLYQYAVPGIYYFDGSVSERASKLKPSKRGELEITDLLQTYANDDNITIHNDNTVVWFDTGTVEELADASNYIRFMQNKFGKKIGDPYHVASDL